MTTLTLITAPSVMPVTTDEIKANSRIDIDDEDVTVIGPLIRAAVARAEMETGRAFAAQTWELVLDEFPEGEIEVPLGPISDEVVLTYIDADGATQTVDEADYYVDSDADTGRVVPVADWPTAAERPNAVRLRFDTGTSCPEDVKMAIKLIVGHWFNTRETATDKTMTEIPFGAQALLSLHRRMFV